MAREYPRPLKSTREAIDNRVDKYAAILDRLSYGAQNAGESVTLLRSDVDYINTTLIMLMTEHDQVLLDILDHVTNLYGIVLPKRTSVPVAANSA